MRGWQELRPIVRRAVEATGGRAEFRDVPPRGHPYTEADGRPCTVVHLSWKLVHFERYRGPQPKVGGPGGRTWCGIDFRPRDGWTRSRAASYKRAPFRSCARCVAAFAAAPTIRA